MQGISPGELAADVYVAEESCGSPRAGRTSRGSPRPARPRIFSERAENVSIQEGTKPRSRLTVSSDPASPSGSSSPRDTGLSLAKLVEQAGDHGRILPLPIVEQHVAAKERITAEDLVRSFSGEDHLVAGVAHGAAQQILRHAVRIEAERLRLRYRIGKMICQIVLPDTGWGRTPHRPSQPSPWQSRPHHIRRGRRSG